MMDLASFQRAALVGRDPDPMVGADGSSDGTSSLWTALSVAGMGLGAYHGYARNESIGWAIAWGLLGGMFPIIVVPVAFAQGFGKKA